MLPTSRTKLSVSILLLLLAFPCGPSFVRNTAKWIAFICSCVDVKHFHSNVWFWDKYYIYTSFCISCCFIWHETVCSFSFHVNINTDSHYVFIQTAVVVSVCGSHADSTEKTHFPSSILRSFSRVSLKQPKTFKAT